MLREDRRKFIKQCAVVGGTAAVVAATRGAAAQEPDGPAQPRTEQQARGYHLTPHIREYYRKASF